jgi:hypothetical protein
MIATHDNDKPRQEPHCILHILLECGRDFVSYIVWNDGIPAIQ